MKANRLGAALVVLLTLAVIALGLGPIGARGWLTAAVLVFLAIGVLGSARSAVIAWCVFVAGLMIVKSLPPAYDVWPVHLALPLAVVAIYSHTASAIGPVSSWASPGSFASGIKILTTVVAVVSALGFCSWLFLTQPDIPFPSQMRGRPTAVVLLSGFAFAAVNAVLEELAFRGVALQALTTALPSKWLAVILQATAFGALHYTPPSIPAGLVGVALTFLYGIALGFLAIQAEGILASSVAHFAADVLVFLAMVGWL